MSPVKTITVVLLIGLAGAVLVAGVLYLQISSEPRQYRPAVLDRQEADRAVRDFVGQCQDFYNKAQRLQPYTWTITEERLGAYLASMDEIASSMPGRIEPGRVSKILAEAGLSEPAVSLKDGKITLMARLTDYDKVLSMGLALAVPSAGMVRVDLAEAKLGRLPLPRAAVSRVLGRLKERLRRDKAGSDPTPTGRSSVEGLFGGDVAAVLVAMLGAVDEKPISARLLIDRKRVQIVGLDITDEAIRLHVEPIGARAAPDAAETRDDWPRELLD